MYWINRGTDLITYKVHTHKVKESKYNKRMELSATVVSYNPLGLTRKEIKKFYYKKERKCNTCRRYVTLRWNPNYDVNRDTLFKKDGTPLKDFYIFGCRCNF